ncbi:MAG: Gfo/Idh/MocA family oxidoreductase [Rhodocyclaceae bacterium]
MNPKKILKAGIVGCGKVGDFHARAFASSSISHLSAVCDNDLARAQAFASRFGDVRAYDNVETMISAERLDVVSICTPHPVHAKPAVTAADLGCHVIIEKPLASNLADCDAIIEAAERNKVMVGTMVQRRFYRPCMRIRQAIDAGKIGKPVLGMVTMLGWRDQAYYASDAWRGTWQGEGGGVMVNQAPHQLDLLLWYMGEVEEVYGVWKNLNHPYIEVEDTAVAVIKFRSGAIGNIVVSNSQNPALHGKVHIFGDNGAGVGVQTDGGAMFIAGTSTIAEPPYNDLWTIPGEAGLLEDWQRQDREVFGGQDFMYHYHAEQIEDFLQAIARGSRPLVGARDGRDVVELFTAIYESTLRNTVIKFPLK